MNITHVLVASTVLASASVLAGGIEQNAQMDRPAEQTFGAPSANEQSASSQTSHSAEVIQQVQEKLNSAGYDAGPVDGMLGPQTEQALTAFQNEKGLQASGQLDSQTLAALEIDGSDSTSSSSSGGSASAGSSSERTAEPAS